MACVVGAFLGREEGERCREQVADLVKGTGPRGAEECFQFGERELDGIEVGAVGREEPQVGARLRDRHRHLGLLVDGEIVEHDDIAGLQRRDQDLFDVGEETRTIDRSIEHRRRAEPVEAQRGDHRVGLPVTAGRVIGEPRATAAPAVQAQEVGGDTALVEKDVLPNVSERLPVTPATSFGGDGWAPLFVGVYRFFFA
jgi:hypothetical protein